MLLLLSWYKFSDEKMQDFVAFYECVTDRQTDRQTDRPTDTAYYRDARTHLKKVSHPFCWSFGLSANLMLLFHFERKILFFVFLAK